MGTSAHALPVSNVVAKRSVLPSRRPLGIERPLSGRPVGARRLASRRSGRTRTRGMVRNANAEAAFEKRPRKQAEVAQHRELLPTKQADGSLKRQRVKLSKKEIAKQRRAESGSEKGKKKKSKKKAEKQASAAASKKRPTSEAALQKMASQVETSAMTLDEKKAAVARLSQRLLQAPHKNVKLLRQLHPPRVIPPPSSSGWRCWRVAVLRMPAYRQHAQPQP